MLGAFVEPWNSLKSLERKKKTGWQLYYCCANICLLQQNLQVIQFHLESHKALYIFISANSCKFPLCLTWTAQKVHQKCISEKKKTKRTCLMWLDPTPDHWVGACSPTEPKWVGVQNLGFCVLLMKAAALTGSAEAAHAWVTPTRPPVQPCLLTRSSSTGCRQQQWQGPRWWK